MRSSSDVESVVSTEFRLLLSAPDSECASMLLNPFMPVVGVAILAGRDMRRSFSFSERNGRLVVNSCVNTFGSGDLAVKEVFDALIIDVIDSRSGVEVIVDNGCVVYH